LIDLGVHALDSAWYLMGTPRPISVSAQVYRNSNTCCRILYGTSGTIRLKPLTLFEYRSGALIDAIDASSSPGRELPIV